MHVSLAKLDLKSKIIAPERNNCYITLWAIRSLASLYMHLTQAVALKGFEWFQDPFYPILIRLLL